MPAWLRKGPALTHATVLLAGFTHILAWVVHGPE